MADQQLHLQDDEDDQLAAARRFWHNYAKPILGGIAIAAVGLYAWHWWQDRQLAQSEAASVQYQQLTQLTAQANLDDGARQNALTLAETLRDQHGGTLYADMAGLIEARLAAQGGDFDAAVTALTQLRDSTDRGLITALAGIDLARVQLAAGNPDQALATLEGLTLPATMAPRGADLRGDILLARGQPEQAREAWQQALTLASEQQQSLAGTQLKLDDLAPAEAS
ncbi:YfgM family protein [Kushneria aurantia]|uniref:Ancillary SecYEG translocon subunit n=1 Tax=Kushneria aurantia TaxID=504092 RepID=A0ABV6G8G9_9GAMM|nr:tetratricopeptide repeat protein [Kushneria aurantia]